MAPLSRFLAGLILQHDTFGTHLDSSRKTIDLDLEIKNFFAAMEVLSEVWTKNVKIDKHPVDCKPVEIGCNFVCDDPDPIWVSRHVQQGRYNKQIVKCLDNTCCEPFKTNWLEVFPTRFMPHPVPVQFGPKGLEVIEMSDYKKKLKLESQPMPLETAKIRFATLQERLITKTISNEAKKSKKGVSRPPPFDSYCPSMMEKLDDLVCNSCGSSWPSIAAKNRHTKAHKGQKSAGTIKPHIDDFGPLRLEDSETEEDETMVETIKEPGSDTMPIISVKTYLKSIYPLKDITDQFNSSD